MFSIISKSIFIIGVVVLLNSCFQDVIEIDPSEYGNQIVIEAVITDQPETQYVKVTRTGDYFTNGEPTPVSNAVVTIESSSNEPVTFEESSPGVYSTRNLHGETGALYFLSVNVDGKVYTAESRMPEPIVLDSLKQFRTEYDYQSYDLVCYFTDHEGVDDYCRFKIYVNNELIDNQTYLYRDRNTDGEKIAYDDFDNIYLRPFDVLKVEVITMDKAAYNYIYTLFGYQSDIDIDVPELFPETTYNPNSNISNNALGYFSACTVRSYTTRTRP